MLFSKKIGSKYFNQNELIIFDLIKIWIIKNNSNKLYDFNKDFNMNINRFLQPFNNPILYNLTNSNNKILTIMTTIKQLLTQINSNIYDLHKKELNKYKSIPFNNMFNSNNDLNYYYQQQLTIIELYKIINMMDNTTSKN